MTDLNEADTAEAIKALVREISARSDKPREHYFGVGKTVVSVWRGQEGRGYIDLLNIEHGMEVGTATPENLLRAFSPELGDTLLTFPTYEQAMNVALAMTGKLKRKERSKKTKTVWRAVELEP